MKIALLEIKKRGDNKDYNSGFGTTFEIGNSFGARILAKARSNLENIPTMSYTYISAIFKKYGHEVEYYLNEVPTQADLVLLQVSLIRHNEDLEYIKSVKSKGLKIGVYGSLAYAMPELFQEADFIIQGEPEQAVIDICETNVIPSGLIQPRPVMHLDSLPFPDWDTLPLDDYSFSPILPGLPFTFVLASRGCPYKCSYCPYKVCNEYRVRKPEKVIEELKYLKERYQIKAFYFRDPCFSINDERIKEFAHLMIQNGLDLKWGCETRLDLLNKPLLELLYLSGMRAIKVGVESIDHNSLKEYGRLPPAVLHQEEIVRFCKKIGIKVIAFYILGLPNETKESIKNTIRYSRKLNTSFASFNICTPIPGTPFYLEMKDKLIEKDLNKYDNFHVVFEHNNLSEKDILKLKQKAIVGYYFRPRYIWRYLKDKIAERR